VLWLSTHEGYQQGSRIFATYTRKSYVSTSTSTTRVQLHQHSTTLTCRQATLALPQPRRAPRLLVTQLHWFYLNHVVHREYSSPGHSGSTSTTPCVVSTRSHQLYFSNAMRREYSSLRRIDCTSTTPRVQVPRLVARLVIDYFASSRLVVDYFAHAAWPGASARRVAHRRLLHPHRASGCLGTSRGSSLTTSPTPRVRVPRHVARLLVDYFAYAAHSGASACHAARRAARRRLLRPSRASRCLSTSRGSSRSSSSTTSPTPRVRVPRHVARLVA
jgi:hypothetical protein